MTGERIVTRCARCSLVFTPNAVRRNYPLGAAIVELCALCWQDLVGTPDEVIDEREQPALLPGGEA